MTNIIPFKKPKKKTTAKKTTEREFAFFDKFEELDKAWHKNEKTFTDIFNTYKEHEKKYWDEALKLQNRTRRNSRFQVAVVIYENQNLSYCNSQK